MPDDEVKPEHEEPQTETAAEPEATEPEAAEPESPQPDEPAVQPVAGHKRFLSTTKGRILLGVGALVVVLGVLLAVPATRYPILGMIIKKDVALKITDKLNGDPVTDAEVSFGSQTVKTDSLGNAELADIPVGPQQITVQKTYYADLTATVNVWITNAPEPRDLQIEATGRQVPVKVLNRITQQPLNKATISALDSTAITDEKGEATIVLPPTAATQDGTIKLDGYNDQKVTITITTQADTKNSFAMTPAGKIYFLSKRSGRIDVMKSNLDGTDVKTVLKGTGKEDEATTSILATRDWQYLILKSERSGKPAKLYLIKTATDTMSVMDEGNVDFKLIGWHDHDFVYFVYRNKVPLMEDGQSLIKSYNADSGKYTTLDRSEGGHVASHRSFGEAYDYNFILLNTGEVVFAKEWVSGYTYGSTAAVYNIKKDGVYSVMADGSNHKTIVSGRAPVVNYQIRGYSPQGVYVIGFSIREYEDGALKTKTISSDTFYSNYRYYNKVQSPAGDKTAWTEFRDGEDVVMIGDQRGESGKSLVELDSDSAYGGTWSVYGWFSNDYLLLSKNSSSIYILPTDGSSKVPLKITNYHRPDYYYLGYGGGYGAY